MAVSTRTEMGDRIHLFPLCRDQWLRCFRQRNGSVRSRLHCGAELRDGEIIAELRCTIIEEKHAEKPANFTRRWTDAKHFRFVVWIFPHRVILYNLITCTPLLPDLYMCVSLQRTADRSVFIRLSNNNNNV